MYKEKAIVKQAILNARKMYHDVNQEYQRSISKYELTDSGKAAARKDLFQQFLEAKEVERKKGLDALNALIAELDHTDAANLEAILSHPARLSSLNTKIDLLSKMDLNSVDHSTLVQMFKEFGSNDPLAFNALSKVVGEIKAANILGGRPEAGVRQQHIRDVVIPSFLRHFDNASVLDIPDDIGNPFLEKRKMTEAVTESFINYLDGETAYFDATLSFEPSDASATLGRAFENLQFSGAEERWMGELTEKGGETE